MNTTAQTFLADILIVIIPILATYVAKYLETIRGNALLNQALAIVNAGVVYTSQTFVDALKKEGRFNKTAQEKAFIKTFNTVEPMFNDAMKKLITDAYGNFEHWLRVQIEAAVKENKKV